MLGHPETVISGPVHELSDGSSPVVDGVLVFIGEPTVIYRCGFQTDVAQIHVAGVKTAEIGDHSFFPRMLGLA